MRGVVLISGSGSNLQAIIDQADNIDLNKELGFDPIKMRLRSKSIFAIKNEEEIKNEINKIIFRNIVL